MPLVKICGLRDLASAQVALENGADLLGMILVPGRARTVDRDVARQITNHVRSRRSQHSIAPDVTDWTRSVIQEIKAKGPFVVGVFRNQSIQEINELVEELGLDFVQLHGKEPRSEYINAISVPVITRFVPDDPELEKVNGTEQILTLFDSEAGGEGVLLNWEKLGRWAHETNARFVLAGGLNPENVGEAVKISGVVGVDVSGGVETDGVKDHAKIKNFIKNAKASDV